MNRSASAKQRRAADVRQWLAKPTFPKVEDLLANQSITDIRARAKAALLGAFVADAACMGLHWLPMKGAIETILSERQAQCRPEFIDPPACLQYQYESGSLSPLGDEVLPLLQSMITHGGFYGPHFLQTFHTALSSYTGHQTMLTKAILTAVNAGEPYPWAASQDGSAACLLKMPAMVARYGGKPELLTKAHDAIRTHQDSTDTRLLGLAFARMLERVLLGQSIAEMLVWASSEGCLDPQTQRVVQAALHDQNQPHADALARKGNGSQATACFYGAVHAAATSATYADAVRNTAAAGGENCGRAQLVGALFAAQDGIESIPLDWQFRAARFKELEGLTDQLVAQRVIIELM